MKIAHIADLHFCRERAKEVFASLDTMLNHIGKNPVDLIAVSGDVFDAAVINSGNAEFPEFIDYIKKLGDAAPVAMVYGTPSHDVDGSLDIFKTVNSKYGITILEPGQAFLLADTGVILAEKEAIQKSRIIGTKAVLFGIPEPRKKYLLAETSAGKDETEAAIRDAMHRLCFMLAAKRKEYAGIPCVVLYHGDVAGSSLQNDQTVERGTGTGITVDDLNDIDGDYYALGHIHKPQRVGNLPAYYSGSVYPKNFGEAHKAGFNVVELTHAGPYGFNADVKRVDFPHPQNLKIDLNMNVPNIDSAFCMQETMREKVSGKRVWIEIICTKEERALVDAGEILKDFIDNGAAKDSRVTVTSIPEETVRAAAITEVKTPAQKFNVWAENTAIEATESVTQKINSLESGAAGTMRGAGLWELESVRLRGATGIKKGVGKDEIEIDFTKFDSGLIALVGDNGKGKTTLIENCHPYPQLLTRRGKLQDHFCLRDSLREVVYRNAQNNQRVKFLIQIDGQNKSGSCKYFIFANSPEINDDFEPLPGVDGNLKPYEDALLSMFGPAELYQRTAHIAQRATKNLPDLTDATAGEKKALFVELAGIDYLQTIADAANEKAKAESAKTHDAEIKAAVIENAVSGKSAAKAELKSAEAAIVEKHSELADIAEAGKTAKTEVDRLREARDAERERLGKENEARKKRDMLDAEISALSADKTRYQEAGKNKAVFEKQIAENDALEEIIKTENAKKNAVLEANAKAQSEYMAVKAAHDKKVKALEIERDNLCDKRNAFERRIADERNSVKLFERDAAEVKENCPTCGQKLPAEKITELENRRNMYAAKIKACNITIEKHNSELAAMNEKADALANEIAGLSFDEPTPPTPKPFDGRKLAEASGKAALININAARKNLDAAREAAVRIEGIEAQISDKQKLLETARTEYFKLIVGIEEGALEKLERGLNAAQTTHSELQERYTACKAEIAGIEARIDEMKKRLREIEAQEKELVRLAAEITASKTECAEWELIARGFGKDGIQALELDALAPGISETANRILESAYGDRFRIEIQTTRMGGSGKKTKQIEDFVVNVIDNEDGEPVPLENKSGGEAVWIKRAIYDAFAVVRKRNTNFAFLTCFQDETDGALDSAAKTAYCRMLEAAHAENKLRHSIIITHSNEVKAMIEQKIDMADFAETETANAGSNSAANAAKENELW